MELILLPNGNKDGLELHYERALEKSVELYMVSAYLTEWDAPANLNKGCETFRFIIGRDFGITRKQACQDVMKWLPKGLKHCFKVAEAIDGFHPKAMFWREPDGSLHALIGSSNLTRAAFSSNHEANVYLELSQPQFEHARKWVQEIEGACIAVSEDWLSRYREAPRNGPPGKNNKTATEELFESLKLPLPRGATAQIKKRREQIENYQKYQAKLMRLFKDCAANRVTNSQFYESLPLCWSGALNNRLQGAGWERQGKGSNFQLLSESFLAIVNASAASRDDVVVREIDRLHENKVASRRAFLSEMLCLRFPDLYPVRNQPVEDYLTAIKFKGPYGASEGAYYVDLAQRLRMSLRANPKHPAKNIAELDTVIWMVYGKEHE